MELSRLLSEIEALKREIDALRPLAPDMERRILQKFRLDWNFHSNSIEGNSLTYGETKVFLMHGLTASGKPLRDHLDIKGHNEVLLSLEEIARDEQSLTEKLIRELHEAVLGEGYEKPSQTPDGQTVMRRIEVGRYKTMPNHVITATGEVHHYASPEETPAKMHDLLVWYRKELENKELHPLLIAALFHHQFVAIHPFDDGNGRLARILMNLVLMQAGYPPVVIKTEKKEDYYRALRTADGGDTTAFVTYIGEQLRHSLELYLKGAQGENIEDYDDIDKQIALLKAELSGEKEKVMLDRERFVAIYQEVVRPLIVKVVQKLDKFHELFFKKEIHVIRFSDEMNLISTLGMINLIDYDIFNIKPRVGNIEIKYNLKNPKKEKIMTDISINLVFKFEEYDYLMILSHPEAFPEIRISYINPVLSEDDATLIVNGLAKNMLAQIQAGMQT